MNMRFFHVAVIVFLTCWCRNGTVTGYVLVNGTNLNPLSGPLRIHPAIVAAVPVNISLDDSSTSETATNPELLIHPRILSVEEPLEVNVNESDKPVAVVLSKPISTIDDPSKETQVSPMIIAVDPIDSRPNNTEKSETEKSLSK
jgi:hypothetical protein